MRRQVARVCMIAAIIAASLVFSLATAFAENRAALVIGNSKYVSVPPLESPANDAKAFADLLTSANFQVMWGADVAQIDIRRSVRDFSAAVAAKGPDTVVFVYFAGYAIQLDGENFLIPTDAHIQREADVPVEALRLSDVINAIAATPAKARFVVVDAAYGNPFSQFNKTSGRGLAVVEAPANSLVAFSAAPGTDGTNRPFTATLINAAKMSAIPFEDALRLVRIATFEASNATQLPWELSKLTTAFALFPTNDTALPVNLRDRPAAFWQTEIKSRQTVEAFRFVLSQDVTPGYEEFLRAYPQIPFASQLRSSIDRRQEMLAWYNATKLNSVASYENFVARYPTSDLTPTARRLLDRARANFVTAATPPAKSTPEPTNTEQQTKKKETAKEDSEPRRRKHARRRDRSREREAEVVRPSGSPIEFGINSGGIGIGGGGLTIGVGR